MIRFENVHKTYKTGTDALRGVTFAIRDGEFVFVIGKSGSGKSTLMKCITREEKPTEGMVIIDKFNISKMPRALVPILRRQIGIIYQDFRLIETKTVEENIAFAGEIIGVPSKKLHQMVDIVLGAVGLRDKANSMPLELSGGEQQRVAIARAMLNNPKLIVADEPTGNLDPETSEAIMALLEEINRTGTTVIVCTHDSNLVDRMKKRVIEVDDGLIIRDEFGSGYTAEDKTALPKSMIDEFVPEVYSLAELQGEQKEEILPAFPQEDKEDKLPEFPSDSKADAASAEPIKKEEKKDAPAIAPSREIVKQPDTIITVVDDPQALAKGPSAETEPVEAKPEEKKPEEKKPSESKAPETKPAEAKQEEIKPAEPEKQVVPETIEPQKNEPEKQETAKDEPEMKKDSSEKKESDHKKDVKEKKHVKEEKAKKKIIEEFEDPDIPSDNKEEG
ncbi:MAG: cell division ATP-binding protein FtsE [Clostridiales bacterium]|nr:cell division ATP-binding protein FtsE [Clostridiales bacterium]